MSKLVPLVLIFLLLGIVGWLWLATPMHRINKASFAAIRDGMSEREVEEIFEVPAGIYHDYDAVFTVTLPLRPPEKAKEWVGHDIGVVVYFDERGRVSHKYASEVVVVERKSFLERFRRWFSL